MSLSIKVALKGINSVRINESLLYLVITYFNCIIGEILYCHFEVLARSVFIIQNLPLQSHVLVLKHFADISVSQIIFGNESVTVLDRSNKR